MRLPKFRCKNKVGNWCFFTILHNGNVNEENFYLETLSEFTGLFDKQGVEIYEGDIVRVKFNNEQVINGEVSFDKGCFMWYQIPQMYGTELVGLVHESEVIGNIYEHAHLLEVKE